MKVSDDKTLNQLKFTASAKSSLKTHGDARSAEVNAEIIDPRREIEVITLFFLLLNLGASVKTSDVLRQTLGAKERDFSRGSRDIRSGNKSERVGGREGANAFPTSRQDIP